MKRILSQILLLALTPSIAAAVPQGDSISPAEKFAGLLKESRPASGGTREARNDLERKAAVERMGNFAARFIDLAEQHPGDPIVLDVLRQAIQIVSSTDSAAQIVWETNRADFATGCSDGSAGRIVAILLRDHIASDKLAPVIDRMRYGYRMEFEEFLTTILRENPHREVQAMACLSLAQFLNDRLRMVCLVDDRPELNKCYDIVFGKDYLPDLQLRSRAELAKRIETLFERAVEEYADVKNPVGGTVGARAESELFGIRHLGIGRIAPDIEGKDQDGMEFKLSDYRGKVVLLYFWSEY